MKMAFDIVITGREWDPVSISTVLWESMKTNFKVLKVK